MHKLSRSLFAGFVAMGALVACDDVDPTPPPPQVTAVNVVPENVVLSVGGTATLAATVVGDAGLTDRTVTWTSSNQAVATVSPAGVVTAVAAGQTTILAKSNADPNVQGAASVVVNALSVPAVSISSVTLNNGDAVDINNVNGQINVTLLLAPNGAPVSKVELFAQCPGQAAPGVLAAGQNFAGNNAPAGPITLSFNTARLNTAQTGPEWLNGACQLTARLTSPGSTPQATPVTLAATFNNADAVLTTVTPAAGPTAGPAGRPWWGGAVAVRVTPVLYSGATAGSVAVNIAGTTTQGVAVSQTRTATGPFPATVTFPTTGTGNIGGITVGGANVAGVQGGPILVTTSALNASGIAVPTPGSAPNSFNYDSQAPAAGTYAFNTQGTANNWIGTAFLFNTAAGNGYTAAATSGISTGNDFDGVDNVTVAFEAADINTDAGQTCTAAQTGLTFAAVTGGSALNSTPVNGITPNGPSKCLRVKERDALGNETIFFVAPATTFGVDRENPILVGNAAGTANQSIWNIAGTAPAAGTAGAAAAATYDFTLRDTLSGFDATPVNYNVTRLFANASGVQQPLGCIVGTGASCAPTDGAQTVAVSGTDRIASISITGGSALEGYFTFNGTARDQAANSSAALPTRVTLVDNTIPTVGSVFQPAGVMQGNTSVAFTAVDALDNVELYQATSILTYPVATIRGAIQQIGTPFDGTLQASVPTLTATFNNFYRSLTNAIGTVGAKPTQVGVRVVDAALNPSATSVRPLLPTDIANASTVPFNDATIGVQSFAITSAVSGTATSPNCTSGAACVVTVTLQGPSGTFLNPFAGGGVNLYLDVAGELVLLSPVPNTAGVQTDNGVNRFYTYTFSTTGIPAVTVATAFDVYAIGFTQAGDALLSAAFAVTQNPAP